MASKLNIWVETYPKDTCCPWGCSPPPWEGGLEEPGVHWCVMVSHKSCGRCAVSGRVPRVLSKEKIGQK